MPQKKKGKQHRRNYMATYMQEYRRRERELLRKAKMEFGWNTIPKAKRRKNNK